MSENIIQGRFGGKARAEAIDASLHEQINESTIEQLKAAGIITDTNPGGIDDIKLNEPQYGETIVGTLTDEEALLFMAFYGAKAELDDLGRELNANTLIGVGTKLREKPKDDDDFGVSDFVLPEQAAAYFRAERRMEYAKAQLYYVLGEKYGCHDHAIGIRTKRRVVRGKSKWKPE